MRSTNLIGFLFVMGLFLAACGLNEPAVSTVEVNRFVEVTRIVEVTRVVEVPRVITKVVVVTATPPPKLTVDITKGTDLLFPCTNHTATRLLDGRILLVGGSRASDEHLAEVELFDPATGLIAQVASLHTPRHAHTATLLPDGRVLVVGGYSLPRQWLDDAEVYDPSADTWTVVPPLYSHGVEHTATLMNDGRVLVVGGAIGSGVITERVEIFNPQTNAWTKAMSLESDRASQTANLLSDGRVLVAGGWGSSNIPVGRNALLYNPQTNTWTATGPMMKMRIQAQSVRLPDGRVLVAGGITEGDQWIPKMSASAEIYDPVSNTWVAVADLSQARCIHVLVPLPDGQVLAVGGVRDNRWTESSFIREVEIYDPLANRWHIVGELPLPRSDATATLLLDGRVWVTGGWYMETHWSDTYMIDLP